MESKGKVETKICIMMNPTFSNAVWNFQLRNEYVSCHHYNSILLGIDCNTFETLVSITVLHVCTHTQLTQIWTNEMHESFWYEVRQQLADSFWHSPHLMWIHIVVIFILKFIDRWCTNHKHSKIVVWPKNNATILVNLLSKIKIYAKHTFIFENWW